MDRKEWLGKHPLWAACGSAVGASSGITAANLIGHWWFKGFIVGWIVTIIVSILVPYVAWCFAADGRKAQQ